MSSDAAVLMPQEAMLERGSVSEYAELIVGDSEDAHNRRFEMPKGSRNNNQSHLIGFLS